MTLLSKDQIVKKLQNGYTVRDLIDELSCFPDDALVCFQMDYGDHGHTQQLLPVQTCDELDQDETKIHSSAYSHSGIAVDDRDGDDEAGPLDVDIVVLSF